MSDPSKSVRARKALTRPKKPYDEFPLYAHPLGYWSKKINGKTFHFGRWGRVVHGVMTRVDDDGFRTAKLLQMEAGELSARMHAEYVLMCDMVAAQFGKDRRRPPEGRHRPRAGVALRVIFASGPSHWRIGAGVTVCVGVDRRAARTTTTHRDTSSGNVLTAAPRLRRRGEGQV